MSNPGIWIVLLIVAGVMLVALEVLLIPGFGVLGIIGLLLIGGAGYLAYTQLSIGFSLAAVGSGLGLSFLLFWLLPKTRAARRLVLETTHQGVASDPRLKRLPGRRGIARTALRPAGSVEIDGEDIDVVSEGGFVEQGAKVVVLQVQGTRVVVRPLPGEQQE